MAKHHHQLLKYNLYLLTLIGICPLELKPHFKWLSILHRIYSKIVLIYFTTFVLSEYVELFFILTRNLNLDEVVGNLRVSLLYGVCIVKINVCKTERVKALIQRVYNTEVDINECQEDEHKVLYKKTIRYNYFVNLFLFNVGIVTIALFLLMPWLIELVNPPEVLTLLDDRNQTVYVERPLVFSSWLPIDKYKYYNFVYGFHVMCGLYGCAFVVVTDIFFFAMMIFATGQLQILQNRILNYHGTAKALARRYHNSERLKDDAEYCVVLNCIKMHQNIIRFVKDLDQLLSPLMMLDFIICSLQMGVIGFQIIVVGLNFHLVLAIEYLLSMIAQMFLFYWHGNELILESINIANIIWESNWYKSCPRVKKLLAIMMLRAQAPLRLSVGPFYDMSTETAITILRGAYSYVALLRQMYVRN